MELLELSLHTMVSLRFPFSFSQPSNLPHTATRSFSVAVTAAAAAATASVAGIAVYHNQKHPLIQNALNCLFSNQSSHFWASLSFADNSSATVVESKTGTSFPSVLGGSRKLLGIGLRKKSVLGLKNIDVYAFGRYNFFFFSLFQISN